MKRAATVVVLLVAVVAAQAAPENSEATLAHESECFECHGTEGTNSGKGGGPAMHTMFRMFMHEPPNLERGASTVLDFQIRNWWTSELQGFDGYIDISNAPALSFEATKPPVHGSQPGELARYQEAAYFQGQERSARINVDIPTGGTDLDIHLAPAEGANADLILRVWTPGQNPESSAPMERNLGAGGEPESVSIRGDPVQGGRYVLEIAEIPDTFGGAPNFDAVGFEVNWTLEYQFVAGATTRNGGTLVVLDGQEKSAPQSTRISWPVNVISNISEEQHVRVYMESVAYYDHPPQFRAIDEWLFWNEVEYYFTPQEDGTIAIERVTPTGDRVTDFLLGEGQVIELTSEEDEGPVLVEDPDEQALDTVAEAIGYTAAFLLIVSLLTGGAFGNWSRRFQQILLYRKAKKRVAFHNVVSYGLILTATIHMIIMLVEPRYPWSVGFFLGGTAIFGMYLTGFTGMFQRPMVRAMGHEQWRWIHYLSFVLSFGGAIGHILLDGIHFADVQAALEWQDPVAPVLEQIIPIDGGNSTAPAEPAA